MDTQKIEKMIKAGGTEWRKGKNYRIYFNADCLAQLTNKDDKDFQYALDMSDGFYYNCVSGKTVFPNTDLFRNVAIPAIKNAIK